MRKFWPLFVLFLVIAGRLPAQQKQGAWWYFGGLGGVLPKNAGVNFNATPPVPDFAGQGAGFSSATISDANGNLLFYADGSRFYNRNHQVMANGNLPFPTGGQGPGMIVLKPGNPNLYYYFNIRTSLNISNFFYSIIDMRLDGGKGGVVAASKNTLVFSTPVAYKLTASLHSNNTDVWIVVHEQRGNNKFYTFLLSSSGLSQPVVSAVGINYGASEPVGFLKSSPNSTLIGDAIRDQSTAQLLDFNRSTGQLSNHRIIPFTIFTPPFGVAFSPDATKLYLTSSNVNNQNRGEIYQYNLTAGGFANVLASKTRIDSNADTFLGDMQLGMDGKIYVLTDGTRPGPPGQSAYNSHLSVINCPNALGLSCSYQDTVIYLNRSGGNYLPALNQTLFRNANQLQVIAARPYICQGESVKLSAFGAGAGQFTWLPAPGLGIINGAEATVQPTVTTTYTVVGTGICNSDTARVTVVVAPPAYVNAGPDQSICSGATLQLGTAPQPGYTYTWHTATNLSDSTIANPSFSVINTGTTDRVYQFRVSMQGPGATCGKAVDTVRVTVKPLPAVNAGPAMTFCSGIPTVLQPKQFNSAYSYSWSPATGLSNANAFAPALTLTNTSAKPDTLTYTLTATFNGCSRSSAVQVIVLPEPKPVIYGPASVCPGSPQIAYAITNHLPINSYTWGVRGGTIGQTFGDSIRVNWGAATTTATVWALGQNSFNCPGDTVFFPVLVNPLLQTEKPKGNTTLCENDKQNQPYQVARAQGSVYTWGLSGGVLVSGQGSHAVRVNWPGPGQYKLWVQETAQTSLAQCYGVSDTLRITVLPSPNNTLTVQGPASVCVQSQQSYSLAGSAGSVYQWQVIGGTIISGQGSGSVQVNWQTVGPGEVKVLETLLNGCAGIWRTLPVQVNPIPVTTFQSHSTFCPEALERTFQVGGSPGATFQWQITGGTLLNGQGTSQATIRWDSTATVHKYTVTETSTAGCSSSVQEVSVDFDRVTFPLLSIGLDEAEENLVIKYQMKNPPLVIPAYVDIFAEADQAGNWVSLGKSLLTNPEFTAPVSNYQARNYYISGQNNCGNAVNSRIHRPVILRATGNEKTGEVRLSWNAYQGWQDTVVYEVWQKLENETQFRKLTATTNTSLALKTGHDGFRQRYRLKALAKAGYTSWSNSVGLTFENALELPNIITPNNDGRNETFTAKSLNLYPNSTLKIFNRWGKEVYQSRNYQGDWKAEGLNSGTYYYLLQTNSGKSFKGWVEVIK